MLFTLVKKIYPLDIPHHQHKQIQSLKNHMKKSCVKCLSLGIYITEKIKNEMTLNNENKLSPSNNRGIK